ncbi:MAG: choice-of-anchor M domain-containing protein [Trueperella sp.]|uniref:choice-of-anchor M domain-containing protein n=1 Tax=Trueperella sp. TaxID=2699835 RepID=UPI0025F51897|nr:choice-of-anchor M domain-containing protein [Trueperella sp.]MCI7305549.1 choice-of-anchor M domain-containing protein [Trueperella sp.]
MSRLSWAKRLAALTTSALAVSFMLPAAATPSEDKAIFDQGHTDSPKVFWENNALTIKASGQQVTPLEKGLHWLHQGYDAKGKQYFYYTAGEDPKYRFLGEAGDLFYWGSPINATGGATNLWIGYGSDAGIPVEKFRDRMFQLELVDFSGPGKMEMFRYASDDDPQERYLSSHQNDYRFLQLGAGAHTHLNTTFSKPGTYHLTYRTTYRDAETGKFVASTPQDMQWQVGGSDPRKATLGDVVGAYNASQESGTSQSFAPKLTLAPAGGDEPMTTLTFDTGDPAATGHVAFYIDGYYLAEQPLTGGSAAWTEMIGSQQANFQAVYVPDAGSPAPRWITAPVTYQLGAQAAATSEAGQFPTPTQANVPAKNLTPTPITSTKVTMSSVLDGENYVITATPEDPNLEFGVVGGFGADVNTAAEECPINFTSTRSSRSMSVSKNFVDEWCDTTQAHWELTPATQYEAARTTLDVEGSPEFTNSATFAPASGSTPAPKPDTPEKPNPDTTPAPDKPDTTPGTDPSDQPTGEAEESKAEAINTDEVTIKDGHIDYGPILMPDGSLRIIVGDDSRTIEQHGVVRDPDSVTLEATVAKRERSQRIFGDETYDFLGKSGTPLYILPQSQVKGLVWPGFSTERLPTDTFPAGTTMTLTPISAPEGAHAWAFTSGLSGLQDLLLDSSKTTTIVNTLPAHVHANWVFTKPGTYEFGLQVAATDKDGTAITSDSGKIRIVVKDKNAGADQGAPAPDTNQGEPKDDKTPDATPSPEGKAPSEAKKPAGTPTVPSTPGATGTGPAVPQLITGGGEAQVEQCIPTPIETEVSGPEAKAAGGSYTVAANTHVHPNWVFTKPGTYKVTITQTAQLKSGKRAQATGTLTFNVGGSGNANSGHFDVGSVLEGDKLMLKVKDDRTQPAKWVDPGSLVFSLGDASKATAPAGLEFIAPQGSQIWMISSASVPGVPWVGANTQHPSIVSGTTGAVTWSLSNVTGPGELAVFSSGNLGQVVGERWFGGASGDSGLPAGVEKKGDKYIKTEWVGKTPSGADCQLSAEQIAQLQAEGKNVAAGQTTALSHAGATVSTLAAFAVVLIGIGGALVVRRRHA